MDEVGDVFYLLDIKTRVKPVVGAGLPSGLDEPHLFIVSYGLLGEVHPFGHITNIE